MLALLEGSHYQCISSSGSEALAATSPQAVLRALGSPSFDATRPRTGSLCLCGWKSLCLRRSGEGSGFTLHHSFHPIILSLCFLSKSCNCVVETCWNISATLVFVGRFDSPVYSWNTFKRSHDLAWSLNNSETPRILCMLALVASPSHQQWAWKATRALPKVSILILCIQF